MHESNAVMRLLGLRQGRQPVLEHALKFCNIAAQTGWNEHAIQGTFLHSLSNVIKDQTACRDEPSGLDELINLAICLDKIFQECLQEKNYNSQRSLLTGS